LRCSMWLAESVEVEIVALGAKRRKRFISVVC
jgi:hypothetical protein